MMNEILAAWQWNGSVSEPVPYGEGHINQTYAIMVTSAQGAKRYILQKINTDTFKDPDGLMELPITVMLAAFVATRFFSVNIILIILVCGVIGALDTLYLQKREGDK